MTLPPLGRTEEADSMSPIGLLIILPSVQTLRGYWSKSGTLTRCSPDKNRYLRGERAHLPRTSTFSFHHSYTQVHAKHLNSKDPPDQQTAGQSHSNTQQTTPSVTSSPRRPLPLLQHIPTKSFQVSPNMTSIPLPGSQSNCASAIIDSGHHSARNHEVGDMAGLNIPIGLPSLATGEDIPASNEPMSFSLQYLLLATRLAFDQGFRVGQASSSHATPPNNISTTEQTTQTVCDSSQHFFPQTSTAGPGGDRSSSQLNPPDYILSCINDSTDQIPRPSQPPGLHYLDGSVVSPLLNGLIQEFEPELPSGLVPVLDSDDPEDDDSDETQRGLTASDQESGRVSHCPQDSAPKDGFDQLPGSGCDDNRVIYGEDGRSEPPHRAQPWNTGVSIEDIEYIDLTIPQDHIGTADKIAEADTIQVQTTPQRQVAFPEVSASGHNDGAGSVDKPGGMGPPPTPPERQAKRKREDPSEQSISSKKQNKEQKMDFVVTQVVWIHDEEKIRYKLDMNRAQQRWVTDDPTARSLGLAELHGEVLMSDYENILIDIEIGKFRYVVLFWDMQDEVFWGNEPFGAGICGTGACHRFDLQTMFDKIC